VSESNFEVVDAFTTGALGRPGQRTFVIQVRAEGERRTIKCEKQHVSVLADAMRRTLADAPTPEERPAAEAMDLEDAEGQDWVLGEIGLGYDRDADVVRVVLHELTAEDDDRTPARVSARLTRVQAVAFCELADRVVAAGRPSCVFCGRPKDPDGHACIRMN
jgi:uncharacterized repeat protein (TIGR03847 family)